MMTRSTFTRTYECDGQRIRDEVTTWRLLNIIPLFTRQTELWRRALTVDDELRATVLAADSYQCVYCGTTDSTQLTIDHVTPQHYGGRSTVENLRTACRSCNSTKQGRTPEEAGMPLVYGRYLRSVLLENANRQSVINDPETARILAFMRAGTPIPEIVRAIAGSTSGAKATAAHAQISALLKTMLGEVPQ